MFDFLSFMIGSYPLSTYFIILILAFAQNISFTVVSRSRNRDHKKYHILASIFSNGIWFLTFRELVTRDMDVLLFIPYTIGTVTGSVTGMTVSMWIEKLLHAQSDSHIKEEAYTGTIYIDSNIFDVDNGIIKKRRSFVK